MKVKLVFYKTIHHFFPGLLSYLKTLPDPRREKACTYPLPTQFWVGVLLFLLKLGSRRQLDYAFNTAVFLKHLAVLTKESLERLMSNDTMAYFLSLLDESVLRQVRYWLINQLLRRKCLAKYRLAGRYLIALDGTGCMTFEQRHCPHCLVRRQQQGQVYYYHAVLEARLVTANGFAVSVETEFIENQPGAKRQDCELKAAYRLLERFARRFPQLRICLLLDSLYVSAKILDICERYNWRFMIVFKTGSAPELALEYEILKPRCPENTLVSNWSEKKEQQVYHWVTDIAYKFEGHHYVNILECLVVKKKVRKGERKKHRWLWLTNLAINKDNCMVLANQGGRLRWKTENEGFNTQKNGGYNLEHAYSYNYVAMKNFYLLMQIAHLFNQLVEKGSLLTDEIKKSLGSIRNIARQLLEDLRTSIFEPNEIETALTKRFQIRFDTS